MSKTITLTDAELHSDIMSLPDTVVALSNGESLISVSPHMLMASMFLLSPGSKIVLTRDSGAYNKELWLAFIKRPVDSWYGIPSNSAVGDVFIREGETKDTRQKVVYMARIIGLVTNPDSSISGKVKPILMMLEGEPIAWGIFTL